MRTVKLRSWFVDLVPVAEGLDAVYRNYLYYSRRRAFNPSLIFSGTFFGSAALAFFDRAGIVALIAQSILAAYLFLSARAVAKSLQIHRTVPGKAAEGETVKVQYKIENPSAFRAVDIMFTDGFAGSLEREATIWVDEPIGAFRSVVGTYSKKCDAGMGVFRYGPIVAVVSDELGIFQFIVTDEQKQETEVYPSITPLPDLPMRGSKESFTYGIYDVASRGLSSNFIGVRDYSRGDSLRHIAWKLTLKARKLLVKEFEKSVNADITLILDMTSSSHMGWQAESTWEYAKDIALSIVAREMSNGNTIQLVSNRRQLPGGQGEDHYLAIIRTVFDLEPEDDPSEVNLAERASTLIRSGATAIYIGPVFRQDFEQVEKSLSRMIERGIDVIAILLDAGTFVKGRVHGRVKLAVETQVEKSKGVVENAVNRLSIAGVLTYVIKSGCDIGQEMLKPAGSRGGRRHSSGESAGT